VTLDLQSASLSPWTLSRDIVLDDAPGEGAVRAAGRWHQVPGELAERIELDAAPPATPSVSGTSPRGSIVAALVEQRFRREQRDFDALFRAHYPEIVRYLAVRLGSQELATDLASEVFVEALRRVPRLSWRGRPVLAWLYRVAANMAADELRRRGREVPVEAPEPDTGIADDEVEALPDREMLGRALAGLPPDHQLVVHLRLVEDYSFAETARLMGRSVGACQMLMLRAARELRAQLEREGIRANA
jgi:RNA polymerase sigma-70 factor (ECF subfamily)